jgi:predicted Zn-dependent protease
MTRDLRSAQIGQSPVKQGDGERRFMSREQCQALLERCVALSTGGGDTRITITSWWEAGVQWARNRAHTSTDILNTSVSLSRHRRGARGGASTYQLDDDGLRDAIQGAERALQYDEAGIVYETRPQPVFQRETLNPKLWSDATNTFDGERRGEVVRRAIAPAESAGLLSAGNLIVRTGCASIFSTDGTARYFPYTRVAFSSTVRDAKGTGSGWAGIDDYDVTRVDFDTLARRALEKCKMSVKPVALEPGRYTTVLEAQAVADLWAPLITDDQFATDRSRAEEEFPGTPFAKGKYTSKINERILDSRINVSSDPMDPEGGFLPFRWYDGVAFRPVSWIEQGVLKQLAYNRIYGLSRLGKDVEKENPKSWRMSGGTTSIDEMIATTKRGVLVTRLHGVSCFDIRSFTCTGYTRDGLWLIEDGKISKPVKNFRFTESPLFSFNRVEQLGVPRRVFSEGDKPMQNLAWIAPPMKVLDFNFTQLADAV